jgi:tRNA-intron endonuclease
MGTAPVKALYSKERVVTENSDAARDLFQSSQFGVVLADGRVQLGALEALYLLEKGRLELVDARNKPVSQDAFAGKCARKEPHFWIRYAVFRDIRNRGYVIKTALKFGADFRVYDRGAKPGEEHAKWIVFPVHETDALTWQEFAAKNRVAHSTKKRLLVGVVDDEGDVSYWEVGWVRP